MPSNYMELENAGPGEILKMVIQSKPSRVYKNGDWAIGNVKKIDDNSLFFILGRDKPKEVGVRDSEGDFTDTKIDLAIYTRIVLDWRTEICGIEFNPEFQGIPVKRFASVLKESDVAKALDVDFKVMPVDNPEMFVQWIRSSKKVVSYGFTFSPSNFRDVEQDIQIPLQKMADDFNGKSNNIRLANKSGLDKERLESITWPLVAAGESVKARCRIGTDGRAETRSSKGSQAFVEVDTLEGDEDKSIAMDTVRRRYEEVRHGGESE